jgi:hypothetical protein
MDSFGNRISKFLAPHDADSDLDADLEGDQDETPLSLHDMRYLDPATARWISEEPIAFAGDGPLTPYVGEAGENGSGVADP